MKAFDAEYLTTMKGLENCTQDELTGLAKHWRRWLRHWLTELNRTACAVNRTRIVRNEGGALTAAGEEMARQGRDDAHTIKEYASILADNTYVPEDMRVDFASIANSVPQFTLSPVTLPSRDEMEATSARRREEDKAAETIERELRARFEAIGLNLQRTYRGVGIGEPRYFLALHNGTRKSRVMSLAELEATYLVPGAKMTPAAARAKRNREAQLRRAVAGLGWKLSKSGGSYMVTGYDEGAEWSAGPGLTLDKVEWYVQMENRARAAGLGC
jgi:hypothetical protein